MDFREHQDIQEKKEIKENLGNNNFFSHCQVNYTFFYRLPGPVGLTGVKGDTGPQGPQGLSGPMGRPGMDGIPGNDGMKGDQGKKHLGIFERQTNITAYRKPWHCWYAWNERRQRLPRK